MNKKIASTIFAGAIALAITSFSSPASAGSFSIQIGSHHGSHHYKHYDRSHHRCTYRTVAVERFYYDECGYKVYYTDYERVRSCDSYHKKHNKHKYSKKYHKHNKHKHHERVYDTHHGNARTIHRDRPITISYSGRHYRR